MSRALPYLGALALLVALQIGGVAIGRQYRNSEGNTVSQGVVVEANDQAISSANPLPVALATAGVSSFSRMPSSAAGINLTTAKPAPGRAYVYQGCNTTASTVYMRVYNAASVGAVTVGSTTPFAGPYAFPANTCVQATSFADSLGIYASSGITYAFGTSPMDTDAAAIGAGAIVGFQIGFQ